MLSHVKTTMDGEKSQFATCKNIVYMIALGVNLNLNDGSIYRKADL